LLNLIYSRDGTNNINLFYISPKTHGEWLSRGHRQIRNILGQAGIHQANRPTSLILLSGFEKDRAERIIEEFEASEVLFGIGDPPTNPDFLDRNEEEQDMLLTKPEIDTFNFPAGSVDGTRSVIQELIHERLPKKNNRGRSTEYETVHNWCMESFAPPF
jgi:hypothetical protein